MAYIATESVKEIRNELKNLLPSKQGFKISVSRRNYSCLEVVILEAPIELRKNTDRECEQIHGWSIAERENSEAQALLSKVSAICNKNNYDRSDSMTDYFDVGYYCHISIGSWCVPFKVSSK